jgi:membrane protease YdiL (CAAX protease family)
MDVLTWKAGDLAVVGPLTLFVLGYGTYWFLANSAALRSFWERRYDTERAQILHVLSQRAVGVLFLGIVPLLAGVSALSGDLPSYGLRSAAVGPQVLWTLVMGVVVTPLVLSFSRRPSFYTVYPLIRARQWGRGLAALNAASWTIYLIAYEFLFRGFVLLSCARVMGVYPAVLVAVALYVCVHIPYGLWVTIGALPLGIAMCLATIQTGAIWPAVVAHVLVALMNDHVAIRANPEMGWRTATRITGTARSGVAGTTPSDALRFPE